MKLTYTISGGQIKRRYLVVTFYTDSGSWIRRTTSSTGVEASTSKNPVQHVLDHPVLGQWLHRSAGTADHTGRDQGIGALIDITLPAGDIYTCIR